jgi:hypothetical protein
MKHTISIAVVWTAMLTPSAANEIVDATILGYAEEAHILCDGDSYHRSAAASEYLRLKLANFMDYFEAGKKSAMDDFVSQGQAAFCAKWRK